ncbi:hypothetical protein HFP69_35480 [Streptomyces sp. ARC12]|uniref:hypothetical protein n=1 Tax=Streptomyces sp. ARC12 TaxID=2724151 RepID=UPI00385751B3
MLQFDPGVMEITDCSLLGGHDGRGRFVLSSAVLSPVPRRGAAPVICLAPGTLPSLTLSTPAAFGSVGR